MIDSNLGKLLSRSFPFIFVILFLVPRVSLANDISKVLLNDDSYVLVGLKVRHLSLLSEMEIYEYEDELFFPYAVIADALEIEYSQKLGSLTLRNVLEGKELYIDLNNSKGNLELTRDQSARFALLYSELYINQAMLEALLESNIEYKPQTLSVSLSPKNSAFLFPVEKKLARSSNEKRIRREGRNQIINSFTAEEVLLDQYQFLTPPAGSMSLSLAKGKSSDISWRSTISLNNEMLYHTARFSLSKQKEGDGAKYLRFYRTHADPYDKLPLWLESYEFGDVVSHSTGSGGSNSGVGFTFKSTEQDFSREYSKTVIEGQATPGWKAELYANGYFIAQQEVSDYGTYKFEDVSTEYGNNTFKVKLFGPYGEEEEKVQVYSVSANRLKPGEGRYKGGIIESNKRLLHGGLGGGFSPTSYAYGQDIGLTDSNQLGLSFSREKSQFDGEMRDQFNASIDHIYGGGNIALQLGVSENRRDVLINNSGNLFDKHNYSMSYRYSEPKNSDKGSHFLTSSFYGRQNQYLPISYSVNFSAMDNSDFSGVTRVSGRVSTSILEHNLYFDNEKSLISEKDYSASLGLTGKAFSFRYNLGLTYRNEEINSLRLGLNRQFGNGIGFNSNLSVAKLKKLNELDIIEDDYIWNLGTSFTKSFKHFGLTSSIIVDSNDEWSISLGAQFNLSYDHINNNLNISREMNPTGGTLDITAFLDRNANNILDENDLALPGTMFGPYRPWQDKKTGDTGRLVLQGVPANTPFSFTGVYAEGVRPVKSSYSLYTHSGGYVKAQIPFTIKTDLAGFVYNYSAEGDIPFKNALVKLIGVNGKEAASVRTSHDGYYEFNDISAGVYSVQVDNVMLSSRDLISNPGELLLKTPPKGGFVEVQDIILSPVTLNLPVETVSEVEFNEDNYDPAITDKQMAKGIYVIPQNELVVAKKDKIAKPSIRLKKANIRRNSLNKELRVKVTSPVQVEPALSEVTKDTGIKMASLNLDYASNNQKLLINKDIKETELIMAGGKISSPKEASWYLQFASFKVKKNAEEFVRQQVKLHKLNILEIVPFNGLFRVASKAFSNVDNARAQGQNINKTYGLNSFPVKVEKPSNKEYLNAITKTKLGMYSIQLASLKELSSLSSVLNKMPENKAYYTAEIDGNYLLFLGEFNSRAAAIKELNQISPQHNITGWVRNLNKVNNFKKI